MAMATILEPAPAGEAAVDGEALYEIVNGQRVELPSMSIFANQVASQIFIPMHAHAKAHRLGTVVMEALLILDAEHDLRRRPDVAFVSAERWPLDREIPAVGDWKVVPNLAVEVVSPNDIFQAVLAKMHEYFRLGVQQVWIVAPLDQEVYVYESPTKPHVVVPPEEVDGGALLAGFRLPLAELFRRQATAGETTKP